MSDRLRMLGVFGAGFALGVVLAWSAPPAPDADPKAAAGAMGPPGAEMSPPGGQMGPPPGEPGAAGLPPGAPPLGELPKDGGAPGEPALADGPIGEPPPIGAGPPDGAKGPPLGEDGGPAPGTDWLATHVREAEALWLAEARALADTHPDLAERARDVARSVPPTGDLPPPLPDVAVLLVKELEALDALRAAGADTSRIEPALQQLEQLR